jgi:hypothetical protein
MYFLDHGRPHFHAEYQGQKAKFDIETSEMSEGKLPVRATGFVKEWAKEHKDELLENWNRTKRVEDLQRIALLE